MKTLRNTMPPSQSRRSSSLTGGITGGIQAAASQSGQTGLPQAGAALQAAEAFAGRVIRVGPAKVPSRPLTIHRH